MHRNLLRIAVVALLVVTWTGLARGAGNPKTIEFDKPAPGFTLQDADGKDVKLSSFRGKTVVLTFWVAGCGECMKQLKKIEAYVEKKKYKDIQYIFLTKADKPEDREKVRREVEGEKLPAVLLFDKENSVAWQYTVTMIPAFYLIDRKGTLASAGIVMPDAKLQTKTFFDLLDLAEKGKVVSACEFEPDRKDNPYVKFEGKPAPDVTAVDASGKKQANFFYKGFSRLLLVYWVPTCPHCRRELPGIDRFYRENRDKLNIEVLAVVASDDDKMKQLAVDYVKQNKISFPIAFDNGGSAIKAFDVKAFPSMILIDRKGNVADTFEGEFAFTADVLKCVVQKMKE